MPVVNEIDHICLDDESRQMEYPFLEVSRITLVNQVKAFTSASIREGADLLRVPVYGVKGKDQLKYIGEMILTADIILKMEYLGLKLMYHESSTQATDFSEVSHLIQLCTNKGLISECFS